EALGRGLRKGGSRTRRGKSKIGQPKRGRLTCEIVTIRVDRTCLAAYIGCAPCPGGGIGRRARFRSVCREAWRFESSPGHHFPIHRRSPSLSIFKKARFSGLFCYLAFTLVHGRSLAVSLFVGFVVGSFDFWASNGCGRY